MNACVVGEAHGFDSHDYSDCEDCYETSIKFSTLLRSAPRNRIVPLRKFAQHFIDKHL